MNDKHRRLHNKFKYPNIKLSIILLLISLSILTSCSDQKKIDIKGNYYLSSDPTQQLIISDSTITLKSLKEDSDSNHPIFYWDESGEMKEAPSCLNIKFRVDSVDSNQGQYVSAYNKDYRCYGYHIIKENNYLALTPLKSLEGIEYHFTIPSLYTSDLNQKIESEGEKLSILIPETLPLDELNYVAFDQDNVLQGDNPNSSIITLDASGKTKSTININPIIYARQNYIAQLIDKSDNVLRYIPVINHNIASRIKSEFDHESQKVEFEKLNIEDLYLIAYRFNPGRKRVVNKVFGEEIIGQVQAFELKSLKKEYGQ